MAKITIDLKPLNELKKMGISSKLAISGGAASLVSLPATALAAGKESGAFETLWETVIGIVDWIAGGTFLFVGVAWMLGHRSQAIERLIGGAIGYLIARHALDIRDFLSTL